MKPILHSIVVTSLVTAALSAPLAFAQAPATTPIKLGMTAALTGPFN